MGNLVVELKTDNNMAKEWFTITKLSRDDLHKIGYDGTSVDDATMQKIADKIEEMFTSSGDFWQYLEIACDKFGVSSCPKDDN